MFGVEDSTASEAVELPWPAAVILCAIFVGSGVMAWELGRRGARYKLRPNRWAGIRTAATLRNEDTWFAAHHKAAPYFKFAGVAGVVGGLMFLLRPQGTLLGVTLGVIAAETISMVVATALGVRAANRTR